MITFRPVNDERPLAHGQGRKVVEIVAVDPVSVICPESLFVNAVTTLGIPLIDFADIRDVQAGNQVERRLVWRLEVLSRDGVTTLEDLRKRWQDPLWLTANPMSELAVARVISDNLDRLATRIREQPFLWRFAAPRRDGDSTSTTLAVYIPSDATDEERAKWLAELDQAAA